MFYIKTTGVPIRSWIPEEEIEPGALTQMMNLSNHPHAKIAVVALPDIHQGYGPPIGSVFALNNHICPSGVGYDIGCGMCAFRTNINISELDTDTLKSIMGEIRNRVPMGLGGRREKQHCSIDEHFDMPTLPMWGAPIAEKHYEDAKEQLGTLGSGNHFIEIQNGDDGYVWAMLHSGSRNVGWQIADHYMKVAKELNEKEPIKINPAWELETLRVDSEIGQTYIAEMGWAMRFAHANRNFMSTMVKQSISEFFSDVKFDNEVNIHHNFAHKEYHYGFGTDLWVHRKGATRAWDGMLGIIPGSQGSYSYIVEGKGNEASFQSCSHGAGRAMSRSKARKLLDLDTEVAKLTEANVIHSLRSKKDLDEATSAYKDVVKCIEYQADLVEVKTTLFTAGVLKG